MNSTKIEDQTVESKAVEKEEPVVDTQDTPNVDAEDSANVSEESSADGDKSEKMADPSAVWQDKYMRLSAEFDNYRKRTIKEKADLIVSGGEDVIKSLLVVLDDMDRALSAMDSAKDIESVKVGVNLIHQKLSETMKNKGLVEIEAIGLALDTDLHEAVAKFPVEDDKKGKIIDVVQKGYTLKDKVVRYAKVVVGE